MMAMDRIKRRRKGFTLLEVVIALTITAVILPGLGITFYQMMTVPPAQRDQLTVSNEVQLVSSWLVSDGQKAEYFTGGNGSASMNLSWTDPSGLHRVTYSLNNSVLTRDESIWNGSAMAPHNVSVAHNIAAFTSSNSTTGTGLEVTMNSSKGKATKVETIYVATRIIHSTAGAQTSGGLSWGPYAIFLDSTAGTNGKDIHFEAQGTVIHGDIHSDGNIVSSNSNTTVYGNITTNGTMKGNGGGIITFPNPGDGWMKSPLLNLPTVNAIDSSDYNFTIPAGKLSTQTQVWASPIELKPGIYHCSGTLELDKDYAVGAVTFIADRIIISGKYCNLQSYRGDLLFWANGSGTGNGNSPIEISNNPPGIFHGVMYAPNGKILLSGKGNGGGPDLNYASITGALVAKEVDITGDNWIISRW